MGIKVEFNDGNQVSVEIDYTLDVITSVFSDKIIINGGVIYYSYSGAASFLNYYYVAVYGAV